MNINRKNIIINEKNKIKIYWDCKFKFEDFNPQVLEEFKNVVNSDIDTLKGVSVISVDVLPLEIIDAEILNDDITLQVSLEFHCDKIPSESVENSLKELGFNQM